MRQRVKNQLKNQAITVDLIPESRHVEKEIKDPDKPGESLEREVISFRVQKYILCQEGKKQRFFPVWQKLPVMELEVVSYGVELIYPKEKDRTRNKWGNFTNWDDFMAGPEKLGEKGLRSNPGLLRKLEEERQVRLKGGSIVVLKRNITGRVRVIDRSSAMTVADIYPRESDLPMAGGSMVWMSYDTKQERGLIVDVSSILPTEKMLDLTEPVFQAEDVQISRVWLGRMLGESVI